MDKWQNEVISLPEDIIPPAFMWRSEMASEQSALESRKSVVKKHYEEIREFLEADGYGDLTRMSNRLETRESRLAERSNALESRLLYVRVQRTAFHDWYAEIESSLGSAESEISKSPSKTKIGEALLDEDRYEPDFSKGNAWKVDWRKEDGTEKALNRMRISYHPSDEEVDPDLQVLNTDFDSAHLYRSDTVVFTGDRNWREIIDRFDDRIESLREQKDKLRKTRELLNFRHGIAETVLFQFEAFGKTVEMTDEKARRLVDGDDDRATGTPETWEKNAAMMHAYFSNHGTPEYLGDVDEKIEDEGLLDSFSHEHTWKILKKKSWASSVGNIQALEEALERWAADFEDKYGRKKADWAADPFDWPTPRG